MAFMRASKSDIQDNVYELTDAPTNGIVYMISFQVDDEDGNPVELVKIGITNRSVYDRLQEILISFLKVYRYVPRTRLLRFKKFDNYELVEKYLHWYYEEDIIEFEKKFSGSTEFFQIDDTDELKEHYDYLLGCEIREVVMEWMPDWAYSDGEKDEIKRRTVRCNKDEYVELVAIEKHK